MAGGAPWSVQAQEATRHRGRRWAVIGLTMVVGIGAALNAWRRAEARTRENEALTAGYREVAARWRLPEAPVVVDLQGRKTLVVGDSMVLAWPWEADRISLAAQATPTIRARFAQEIGRRYYDQIVLWPGTAHFLSRGDGADYERDLRAMIEIARAHGTALAVIGPFPVREEDHDLLLRVEGRIRRDQPKLRFISLVDAHDRLEESGALRRVSRDGIHLTKQATAMLLGPQLASLTGGGPQH